MIMILEIGKLQKIQTMDRNRLSCHFLLNTHSLMINIFFFFFVYMLGYVWMNTLCNCLRDNVEF